jgi:hypothetical protein
MADFFIQQQVTAVITAASALSPQVDLGGYSLVGVVIPSNWITATLSFQASPDGGVTWGELLTAGGTPYAIGSVTGGAPERIAVDPTALRGVRSLKVRSGTSASPTNQTNTVSIILLTRPIY